MSPTSCQTAPPRACRNETASIEKRNYSKASSAPSTLAAFARQPPRFGRQYLPCFQSTAEKQALPTAPTNRRRTGPRPAKRGSFGGHLLGKSLPLVHRRFESHPCTSLLFPFRACRASSSARV